MQIVSMKMAGGTSKIKAFFDVETPDHIIIKGFKVAEGTKGLFVGVPSEKGTGDKWFDRVILPPDIKEQITKAALAEYSVLSSSNTSHGMNESKPQPNDDTSFPF